jgi:outer membrane scaffolding protein for murein synthesis (MipA/OmpV family)
MRPGRTQQRAILLALASLPLSAGSAERPLWEIGAGVGALTIPQYRGADEHSNYVFPLPYLQYRGELFRVDREGIQGMLFRAERLRLKLSVAAAPPAKSGDGARDGMPDLDPAFEFGPALEVRLAGSDVGDTALTLNLPLRAVLVTDLSHIDGAGWVFSPYLQYETQVGVRWSLDVSLGPIYASEAYHDYYYEVAPEFATPQRPVYDADGGYSGSRITVSLSKRFPRFWVGAFARYDNLSGAIFADSPLVRTEDSFMAGIGVAWILAQSETTVESRR